MSRTKARIKKALRTSEVTHKRVGELLNEAGEAGRTFEDVVSKLMEAIRIQHIDIVELRTCLSDGAERFIEAAENRENEIEERKIAETFIEMLADGTDIEVVREIAIEYIDNQISKTMDTIDSSWDMLKLQIAGLNQKRYATKKAKVEKATSAVEIASIVVVK